MPNVALVMYREDDGSVPLLEWLEVLVQKARLKCLVRLELLAESGHELRRPVAEYLGNGIHELRMKHLNVNYRLLYFFHGTAAVVVSHGFTKQRAAVPTHEITLAARRRKAFESNPVAHTYSIQAD